MKKVSLITTFLGLPADLTRSIQEIKSFTQKLPVPWELLIILDPPTDMIPENPLSTEQFQVKLLLNSKKLGRSRSILKGLCEASGDVMIVLPLDMTIPLAEVFQFLQELTVDKDLDLVVGNRFTSRKKMISVKNSWHQTLENILLEKIRQQNPTPLTDPLCSYFGIRKETFDLISNELKFSSWYYLPELLKKAHAKGWKILEVPILSRDQKASSIPLWRELARAAVTPSY